MGMDSVELVMEWEKYFGITISDYDAQNIRTVQDTVELISSYLNIVENDLSIRDQVYVKLEDQLFKTLHRRIEFKELISDLIPETNKYKWTELAKAIELRIPIPTQSHNFLTKTISTLFSQNQHGHRYDTVSVGQMIDVICAANYKKLIDVNNIKGKYELYAIIVGITVEKLGLDFYEVQPYKRYVDDFGIS